MADIERVLGFAMHTRTLFASITILLLLIAAPLPIVQADDPTEELDTAQRDDVVEEETGVSEVVDQDTEGLLPGVDAAKRDDVVYEGEGATGSAGNAPAPAGRKVTLHTEDSVSLSWHGVPGADSYKVEYRRSGSVNWLRAGYAYSGTSYMVNRLDCNTRYDFQALARGDGSTYSLTYVDPSSSVSETTAACVAPATTGPGITSDTEDSVILSWNVVTDTTSYKVEYRMTGSISWFLPR